jgi:hypothetical protein
MLDDGIYGLSFESRLPAGAGDAAAFDASGASDAVACGEGLALLRGGVILGSDPHGGVFRGRYAYDAGRGDILVEVRLVVPPHGVLLTGLAAGPDGAVVEVSGRFPRPKPVSSAVVDVAGAPVTVALRYVGAFSS